MVWWSRPRSSSSAPLVGRNGARFAKAFAAATIVVALSTVTTATAEATPVVEEYAIVVSPDVKVTNLSLERVRRMFLFRETYWRPGLPVRLLFSESGVEPHSFLLDRIYRMEFSSLRRLIVEKLYQEDIDLAPKVVASDEVAVVFVASGKGLIALVRASVVQSAGANPVAIDGLLPGVPGYALRR
jgi:hypothetical protein